MALDIQLTRLHGPLLNYGVLIHDQKTGETACVDAGEAEPIFEVLDANGWKLTQLWVTHHHHDHVYAIEDVKAKTGCTVYGPSGSCSPIKGIDIHAAGGDVIDFAGQKVEVIHTPGHTLDMLNYYFPDEKALFAGDTLFTMGCGRLFEGTPELMFKSLKRLSALPRTTTVYCAHEYSLANAEFAKSVFPDNEAIATRHEEIAAMRKRDEPTVITTIGKELKTNPFLLAKDDADFARLRALKDQA